MTIKLPIELRYFTLKVGTSTLVREGDLDIPVYAVVNKETGMVEAEGRVLADIYNTSLSMDINMEHASVFFAENAENLGHLKVADEEAADEAGEIVLPGEKKLHFLN